MRNNTLRCLAALALAAALACSRGDADSRATASAMDSTTPAASTSPMANAVSVRVVNAMPGVAHLAVFTNDVSTVSDVAFKGVSDYQEVTEGVQDVAVARSGSPEAAALAASHNLDLRGGTYTLVAFGPTAADSSRILVMRDDGAPTDPARARLRLVDAANGAGDLEAVIQGDSMPVATGIRYGISPYEADVNPGTTTLTFRQSGGKHAVQLRVPGLALVAGQTTTVIVTHQAAKRAKLIAITVPASGSGAGS